MSKATFHGTLSVLVPLWFLACSENGPDYVPGEVAVWFVPGTTESQVEGLASDLGVGVRDMRGFPGSPSEVDSAIFVVPEGEELEWVRVIQESPIVEYASLNGIAHGFSQAGCSAGM